MMLEERYVVFKSSDLKHLTYDTLRALNVVCDEVARVRNIRGNKTLNGVFIESDWPEYEPTVKMLEQRINNTKE